MTQLQSIATIIFSLSILILAVAGQARIGVLILAVAMIASVITVLYGLATSARRDASPIKRFDWN